MQTEVEGFRLSPQQRHLWSLRQDDGSLPYHAQCAILIEGILDRALLDAALRTLFDRYEILRTTFRVDPGTLIPLQSVSAEAIQASATPSGAPWSGVTGAMLSRGSGASSSRDGTIPIIAHYDLRRCTQARQAAAIEKLYRRQGALAFDFEQSPLPRLSLIAQASDRHVLLMNLPALCADSASLDNLMHELGRCYSAAAAGDRLTGEPLQYADAAEWQNELLESAQTLEGRKYWLDQPILQSPRLPSDRRPIEKPVFDPRCLSTSVKPQLAASIIAMIDKYDTSPAVFLMACWQTLLWRLSGQSDFLLGAICDGRTYEGLQEAVGPFEKTLPLPCHLAGDLRFGDLLQRVDKSLREIVASQEYFSWDLFAEAHAHGDPFFPIAFEFIDQRAKYSGAGVTFSVQQRCVRSDRFTLKLSAVQTSEALITEFHYDSNSFAAADIDRLQREFQTMLESIAATAADINSTIAGFKLLSGSELRQLLVEFNDTGKAYPNDQPVHQLFEQQVARTPGRVAATFAGLQLTYAALNARVNQLAHHLGALGVAPEVPVAICLERSLDLVVAVLAVLKAGGAYVPLDPTHPVQRLLYQLKDVKAPVLLTQKLIADKLPAATLHVLSMDSEWPSIERCSDRNPPPAAAPGNLAYVIYTSGSTGSPKGVMVEHRGLTNAISWIVGTLGLSERDSCLLKTPITFDAAGRELFPTLISGGRLVIAEPNGHRDSYYLADLISHERVSILHCVPSMLRLLVEEPALHDAPALRAVMSGGEALPPQTVTRFYNRRQARLYNVYGPTEAIIDATCWPCDDRAAGSTTPIGRPIPNARIYILDDLFRLVPIGVAGHLYIGGAGLARGYVGRPDLTAEKFIPDPFSDHAGARLYRTGDIARYLPDGSVEFIGRIDHQVKIRGFRIELGEIEGTLEQHPRVRQAIVVVHGAGPDQQRLVAYVAATSEVPPTANDLRGFLHDRLPEHMVPAVFILLDALPLTPNGKVDRHALPTPDERQPELDEAYAACRTPTEELLVEIWRQVLGVARVGIHDDFFRLGGHSLLATQVVSRIREAFQTEMPLLRLFETPTVAGLAEHLDLDGGKGLRTAPIVPVPRGGELPLSFAQQRLWFIDRLEPGGPVYNFPAAVRLKGPLNLAALERSLNEIVNRHEALRTTFTMADGRPVQVIAPLLKLTVPLADLRILPASEREDEVQRLATLEAHTSFDLAIGPLVRARVLRLDENEHVGLLTMHHIVADGWSIGILIRELAILYEAYCSGRPSPLPALPIQYADFAHWQRQWLTGEVLDTQLSYWKQRLLGAPPLMELLADYPRPAIQSFRGTYQSVLLPKAVGDGLKALSRRQGVTLFMTLFAAFQILLHRYTNQDDLVVGTPIANRTRLETEGLIGFFVNTLVLRTNLADNPGFPDLLRRVREVCLGAYAHQDVPFERLVEELHLARDLSRNPLFQVMFVLQNAAVRTLELPGMSLSPVEIDSGTTHFDLTLHIADTEPGLNVTFAYNTDLFEASTIARMLGYFGTLLEAVVATPERHLSELTALSEVERQQILVTWNGTHTPCLNDRSVPQLFETQVAKTPDAIALVFEDERLTYRELNRRANQLANHLRVLGVGSEVPVGICLNYSTEAIVGLLGILKAGGVYLPLDPAYPKARLAFMLEDAEVPILLTQKALLAGLPANLAKVVWLDSDSEVISRESAENPVRLTRPENLAYIIYTSGSTGRPKGVAVAHRSIADHCLNIQGHYELTSRDNVLQFASLSFDLSLEQILPTLIAGATLVMMSTDIVDTAEIQNRIAKYKVTVVNIPTGYWQELTREWADNTVLVPNIQPRLFIVGGDELVPEFLDLWRRTPMNSVPLINAYGPTETTITATACAVAARPPDRRAPRRIPIGRPLENRETYILNQRGNPVPVGVPGELYIGGTTVARGYLNRADLTAETFVPNPFSGESGARLYRTGDRARYLADGNIEFLGRIDHQVKIRGYRVELGEIEAAVRQHPAVRETIVLALGNDAGDKQLVVYLVAQPETSPTTAELRSFLKEKLPDYMIPAVFVPLQALPLLPNGKVDRGALPEPGQTRTEPGNGFVAPRNALELRLSTLWEEVLGIRPIGVTDNFFELGGHSLAAVRLFALIEKRFGKKVPLATVFQGPTVEHLAKVLQRAAPAPSSSLVPIQPAGEMRPLFLIHPAGGHVFPYVHLAHNLGSNQPCYGLQSRGLEEGQEPHSRIEDMAVDYIDAIRVVQPEGPYLLGGWSMGGVVAFEMAQHLHAQGQKIGLLALLDARIPAPDEEIADEDFEARLLVDFVRYFGLSLDPRDALARLPKHELLARVLEQAKRAGLMPADIEVSHAQPFIELCKADFRATRNYVLHRYPGRITLFKAGQELAGTSADPTLGWGQWAAEGLDLHVVPGNHATMVYKPHVEVLAEKLRYCLEQTRATEKFSTIESNSLK